MKRGHTTLHMVSRRSKSGAIRQANTTARNATQHRNRTATGKIRDRTHSLSETPYPATTITSTGYRTDRHGTSRRIKSIDTRHSHKLRSALSHRKFSSRSGIPQPPSSPSPTPLSYRILPDIPENSPEPGPSYSPVSSPLREEASEAFELLTYPIYSPREGRFFSPSTSQEEIPLSSVSPNPSPIPRPSSPADSESSIEVLLEIPAYRPRLLTREEFLRGIFDFPRFTGNLPPEAFTLGPEELDFDRFREILVNFGPCAEIPVFLPGFGPPFLVPTYHFHRLYPPSTVTLEDVPR